MGDQSHGGNEVLNDSAAARLRCSAQACAIAAFALGVLGLASWLSNQPVLSSFSANHLPMSPRAAVAFILSGAALFVPVRVTAHRLAGGVTLALALLLVLIGGLSLVEILLSTTAGHGGGGFRPPATFDDYTVIRMSRVSAVCFLLFGAGMTLLVGAPGRRITTGAPIAGLLTAALGGVALLGYLYGTPQLFGGNVRPVAISAAAGFVFLGVGLIAAGGPRYLPLRLLVGPSIRAQLLRRFLPIVFAVVLLGELLADAFRWYATWNPALQAALQTLFSVVVVSLVVFAVARVIGGRLDQAEAARRQAEQQLQRAHDELEQRVQERTAQLAEVNTELQNEIAERKRSEQVVRASEERFRQLAENIREVFWITSPELDGVLYISPGYERIWGRSCDSLYASPRDWLEAVHPEDRPRVQRTVFSNQLTDGFDEVYRILRPDGSLRWIRDRGFPVRDEAGALYRVVGIAEDITERVQAETRRAAFSTLGHRLSAAATPKEAARIIVDVAAQLFGWNACFLHLCSPGQDAIVPVLTLDTLNGQVTEVAATRFSLRSSSLMRLVIEQGPQLINRGGNQPLPATLVPFGDVACFSASMMYAPMRGGAGCVGVLSIQSYSPNAYTPADLQLFQALADHCAVALERIAVTDALRESEERFRALFESAPLGIVLRAASGELLQANRALEDLLGYSERELQSLAIQHVTHPDDVAECQRLQEELKDGKRNSYRSEKRCVRKDGSVIWVRSSASAIRDKEGRLLRIVSVVEDITQRRKDEAATRQLAAIVESSEDAIISLALDTTILSWNRSAERLFGYTAAEAVGRSLFMIVPADRHVELEGFVERLKRGERIVSVETVRQRKDGTLVDVALSISPLKDGTGTVIATSGIVRDITERKRLEREVLEIGARERRLFGHELHDGLGQHLTATAFKAKALEQLLGAQHSPQTKHCQELIRLLDDAITTTRRLARGLDPIHVERRGLADALQSLAEETRSAFKVDCRFHCSEWSSLPDALRAGGPSGPEAQTALVMYRITQEAVHNAVRHARPRRIDIELAAEEKHLRLVIRDDGHGFRPEATTGNGLGLRIMQHRAQSVNGRLEVKSGPDGGTEICCLVPRRNQTAARSAAL